MTEPRTSNRRPSLAGRLARLGFSDAGRAQRLVRDAEADDGVRLDGPLLEALLGALGGTADPDLALSGRAAAAGRRRRAREAPSCAPPSPPGRARCAAPSRPSRCPRSPTRRRPRRRRPVIERLLADPAPLLP
ncbi:hypothetical protein BJF79_25040 [Actinomadura sp. CNU-125]|uniref:hypothetical protein n=1 Tax=Actinomadura sp. CNU-125 TaxID=1904961 RepID=UPI000965E3AA|nr:hypothetical protein [Actinomadura sp. CNU-125]OLT11001.1 hypothetical protein BJF79_25040 [Actinomadura sp. CNU-125]